MESTNTHAVNTVTILCSVTTLVSLISSSKMSVTIPDFFEIEVYTGRDYLMSKKTLF